MSEIRNLGRLEQLLAGSPPKFSATVAVRAALKFLPLIAVEKRFYGQDANREQVLLACFNAIYLACISSRYSDLDVELALSEMDIGWVARSVHHASPAADASSALVSAVDSVVAVHKDPLFAAISAGNAANYASLAANAAADKSISLYTTDAWHLVQVDRKAFDRGIVPWSLPLWGDDLPGWMGGYINEMSAVLLSEGPHWRVFIDWYQDRLDGDTAAAGRGRPSNREMEIEIGTISNADWEKGAKHVLERIRTIQERYWGQTNTQGPVDDSEVVRLPEFAPTQEPHALSFTTTEDGRIGLASTADVGEMLLSNPSRQEDYTDLREKAEDIQALGANRVGDLLIPIQRLLALSDQLTLVRGALFWSKANTLRKIAEGHQAALGDSFDERRLDLAVGDRLVDLVETINVFMIGDPLLRELDAARPGPQEAALAREEVQSVEAALTELADSNIMTDEAGEALSDEVTAAQTATDTLVGRQRVAFAARTARNAVFALVGGALTVLKGEVKFASKEVRGGFYKTAGGGIAFLVWQYRAELMTFAATYAQSPALQGAIKYVVDFLSRTMV